MQPVESNVQEFDHPEYYLSGEQRLDLVADLLATIALRVLKSHHGQDQTPPVEQ